MGLIPHHTPPSPTPTPKSVINPDPKYYTQKHFKSLLKSTYTHLNMFCRGGEFLYVFFCTELKSRRGKIVMPQSLRDVVIAKCIHVKDTLPRKYTLYASMMDIIIEHMNACTRKMYIRTIRNKMIDEIVDKCI